MIDIRLQEDVDRIFGGLEHARGEDFVALRIAKGCYRSGMDAYEANMIAQLESKESFPNRDFCYVVNPPQSAYDLYYSGTAEGRMFRRLNESYWFHNEAWLTHDAVIPYPKIKVTAEDEVRIEGARIRLQVNNNSSVDNLERAGIFKASGKEIRGGRVYFGKEFASFWSMFNGERSFYMGADKPLGNDSALESGGLVALAKVPFNREVANPEVRRVASEEHMELMPVTVW